MDSLLSARIGHAGSPTADFCFLYYYRINEQYLWSAINHPGLSYDNVFDLGVQKVRGLRQISPSRNAHNFALCAKVFPILRPWLMLCRYIKPHSHARKAQISLRIFINLFLRRRDFPPECTNAINILVSVRVNKTGGHFSRPDFPIPSAETKSKSFVVFPWNGMHLGRMELRTQIFSGEASGGGGEK